MANPVAHSWVCATVLLVVGCGLGDYENRMRQAQDRLKRFEEEQQLLDQPLVMPTRPDKNKQPQPIENVHLRPPRGIAAQSANPTDPRARMMYTYRPTTAGAAGPFAWVELAFGSDEKTFAARVLACYTASGKPVQRQRQVRLPDTSTPITFEVTEFEDATLFYSVNVWRSSRKQAAIVYAITRGQRGNALRAVDLSMETFGIDEDADRLRQLASRLDPRWGPLTVVERSGP